ncbi:uncharacterized protein LOC112563545 isoform X2 [Pomacea canaliculata]|uniref:uncharacterized protein LOC112563545 isoform X2 n=1 Tax=Pomacea canaliculata TaxID=400727 RepID=UPI000D729528|nr:uncharacterized protein LOC112563545 isoform X2 [Pomacea canaliculata]
MAFSTRDVKDISDLVSMKLKWYLNVERRELQFDPNGFYRTTPLMHPYDNMYHLSEMDSNYLRLQKPGWIKRHAELKDKERTLPIKAKVVQNSRTVVSLKEAERLSKDASKIFSELPLDKLQVIHRYRPESTNIPPIVENGHVQNYTCHVGSALHAKNYVDFYMKEGLQTGKGEYSKRLQRLKSSKKKADIAQRDKGNSQNKAREDNYSLLNSKKLL